MKRWQRRQFGVIVVVLILLVSVMGYRALKTFFLRLGAQEQERRLSARIDEQEKRRAELEQKIEDIRTGRGLEYEARTRLNLKKSGERVLIIIDENQAGQATSGIAEDQNTRSVFKWFASLFGSWFK